MTRKDEVGEVAAVLTEAEAEQSFPLFHTEEEK